MSFQSRINKYQKKYARVGDVRESINRIFGATALLTVRVCAQHSRQIRHREAAASSEQSHHDRSGSDAVIIERTSA